MPSIDLVGSLAAALTPCALVPQAHPAWKTRRTEGISVGMYAIFITGVALWLVYGILIGAWPVILALRLRHGDAPK